MVSPRGETASSGALTIQSAMLRSRGTVDPTSEPEAKNSFESTPSAPYAASRGVTEDVAILLSVPLSKAVISVSRLGHDRPGGLTGSIAD
jgi:hypothetical protein